MLATVYNSGPINAVGPSAYELLKQILSVGQVVVVCYSRCIHHRCSGFEVEGHRGLVINHCHDNVRRTS